MGTDPRAGERRTLGRGPGPRRGRWGRILGWGTDPRAGGARGGPSGGGQARGGSGPSPAQPRPARPQSLGMKPPVVRARPADPATLGPAFHSPGSRVGGKERRGSGAWLPAKAAAFGPGATRRPRLGGGRGGQRPGGSSAMGSRSSHAARIPDVDSLRRETGCECGAPRPGARRGPRRLRWGSRGLEPRRSRQPGSLGDGGAFTQGSRLRVCGRLDSPGPALHRMEGVALVSRISRVSSRPPPPCPLGPGEPSLQPAFCPQPTPCGRRVDGACPGIPARPQRPPYSPDPLLTAPRPRPAVSQASLRRLYDRFQALDRTGKGYLR